MASWGDVEKYRKWRKALLLEEISRGGADISVGELDQLWLERLVRFRGEGYGPEVTDAGRALIAEVVLDA